MRDHLGTEFVLKAMGLVDRRTGHRAASEVWGR
jgi:hypothetical protein